MQASPGTHVNLIFNKHTQNEDLDVLLVHLSDLFSMHLLPYLLIAMGSALLCLDGRTYDKI